MKKKLNKAQLAEQAWIAYDALEEDKREHRARKRTAQLMAPIRAAVAEDAHHAGYNDYKERRMDVEIRDADPDWAWPFGDADAAYLGAVSGGTIMRRLGLPPRLWEHVEDVWLKAFARGYAEGHADHERATKQSHSKKAARLNREIAAALRKTP